MVKVKIKDLVGMVGALKDLLEKEVPIKTAIKITRVVKAVEPELEVYEKKRADLISKHRDNMDEKGNIIIKPDSIDIFQNHMDELLNTVVEIDIQEIEAKEFGDITVSTKTLLQLQPIIKE